VGLNAGYKTSEVGIIPNDWDVIPFRELFEFQNGVNADKKAYGSGIRFINVLEVITHAHLRFDQIPGQVTLSKLAIANFAITYGDVLFNRTSETQEEVALSAVYVGAEPVVFGGFVIRGRPRSTAFDPIFTGYALRSRNVRAQIIKLGQGAVRANVGQKDLAKILAPRPTAPEQQSIARALSDVDVLIASLDTLMAKKRDLKQAAMQQLLTGKIRLPGFSAKWESRTIRSIGRCYSGGTPRTSMSTYYGGDIPWITSADLNTAFINEVVGRITQSGLENSSAKLVNPGTVLVAMYGATAGVVAISNIHGAINQAILAIELYESEPKFVCYSLQMRKDWIVRTYTQGGQPNLSGDIVKSLKIEMPTDRKEQVAVVSVLSDMDAELSVLEAQRDKAVALKLGMMQELLTGRIRLL
jgi:type I restriction enzyme S subunit